MTLEGCVVRMADTISYIGRDLEDGIRLGLITREQIPEPCRRLLGSTNGTIVFTLVTDLIAESLDQPFIDFRVILRMRWRPSRHSITAISTKSDHQAASGND